ncbi:MAG: 5'-deoxynucleotidase, partial [Glaciecola sp.]
MSQQSTFIAWITRMSLIQRWALMHAHVPENVSEHSHQVGVIAHLLTVIHNHLTGEALSAERAATLALFHEVSETKMQDVNSNTKYQTPEIAKEFKKLEELAERECLSTLPDFLQSHYEDLIVQNEVDPVYKRIVKSADIICAYIKALNELRF